MREENSNADYYNVFICQLRFFFICGLSFVILKFCNIAHSCFQAIDIWMGACTAFIFAALLEFTLTNYLWRKGLEGRLRQSNESTSFSARTDANATSNSPTLQQTKMVGSNEIPLRSKTHKIVKSRSNKKYA